MKLGDLVYSPFYGAYGIIVSKYHYDDDDPDAPNWNVVQFCGYRSQEYEEDLEIISESNKGDYNEW